MASPPMSGWRLNRLRHENRILRQECARRVWTTKKRSHWGSDWPAPHFQGTRQIRVILYAREDCNR
jgi:hypothetical protein